MSHYSPRLRPTGSDADGFALGFIDRAPLVWRVRALRCRLLEIREGVGR